MADLAPSLANSELVSSAIRFFRHGVTDITDTAAVGGVETETQVLGERNKMTRFTLAGRTFSLDRKAVESTVAKLPPDFIHQYYTTINQSDFPVKQVVSKITGLGPAEFHTGDACRILRRLGFMIRRHPGRD